MTTEVRATIPSPAATSYDLFLALAQEKKWKILETDEINHTLTYKVSGNTMKLTANLTPLVGNQTQLRVTSTYAGAADISEAMTASFIELLLSTVNAKLRAEAEATLVGTSREEVLFSNQSVTPVVAKLLLELQSGLSAYNRRDAAKALGALREINERTVAALLLAMRNRCP